MVSKYHEYWDLVGVEQHSEFENALKELLFKPKERKEFYEKLLEEKNDMSIDSFREYFELYAAERKTNQQDFTPDGIAKLITKLRDYNEQSDKELFSAYDPAAGTGVLIIAAWHSDRLKVAPWHYFPHNYFYMGEELSNSAVVYLIHNLAIRGMNAIVLHGDSVLRKYKQAYFIQNSSDDHMKFSDINVLPHIPAVERMLDVREWTEEAIDYKESQKVTWKNFHQVSNKNKRTLDEDTMQTTLF